MSYAERIRYKEALASAIVTWGCDFHVMAALPTDSRLVRERQLRRFVVRMNRLALGRNWHREINRERRMRGIAVFELGRRGGGLHAHLMLVPPVGLEPEEFMLMVLQVWSYDPLINPRIYFGAPITWNGTMYVQRVGDSDADRHRVARYDLKGVEFQEAAISEWKFIDDLASS